MNLLEWKNRYGRPELNNLARQCDSSGEYFAQIAHGYRSPSHKLARVIEAQTNGVVTRFDLRPDIFGPPPAPSRSNSRDQDPNPLA